MLASLITTKIAWGGGLLPAFTQRLLERRGAVTLPFAVQNTSNNVRNSPVMMFCSRPEASPVSSDKVVHESDGQESLVQAPPDELMQSLDSEGQRKLQLLWMEVEVLLQSGNAVPLKMSQVHWQEAMNLGSRFQRLKFYKYLCIREVRREREALKKIEKRKNLEEIRELRQRENEAARDQGVIGYGLTRNTLFHRLYESAMNMVYNHWQCQGILYGQSFVVDLGYDEHMVSRERKNCAEQIKDLYAFNKMNREPFHLHICNANPGSPTLKFIASFIPNLYSHNCLMTVTEKSYLDLFPKERLVYLTPHCKEQLTYFDHDSIYIIGGLVDKTVQQAVSLAKAKREGLRMARLPLDDYLDWGCGNKSLTLDQMMKIMLDIKNTGDWDRAFQHIPRRKIKDPSDTVKSVRKSWSRRSLFSAD